MNSNRLLRAIVTCLTILASLWFLHLLGGHRSATPSATPAKGEAQAAVIPVPPPVLQPSLSPPSEVVGVTGSLPFVAMDNSCLDGQAADLSGCTGMLSGGRAREYAMHVTAGQSLRVTVDPMYEEFDVSFALLKEGNCILGRDAARKGESERATVTNLSAGDYRLLVGGYDGDCGPYLLTVDDEPASLAQIQNVSARVGRNGTVLRWKSFGEVDVTQYQIYRLTGENRERIAVLRAHGSPAGFSDYRFVDRGHLPGSVYEVEMVARDGRSERIEVNS